MNFSFFTLLGVRPDFPRTFFPGRFFSPHFFPRQIFPNPNFPGPIFSPNQIFPVPYFPQTNFPGPVFSLNQFFPGPYFPQPKNVNRNYNILIKNMFSQNSSNFSQNRGCRTLLFDSLTLSKSSKSKVL